MSVLRIIQELIAWYVIFIISSCITCKGSPEEQNIVYTVDTPTIQENNTTKDTSSEG